MDANYRLTVFMPVYNGEDFVGEAIESILGQTYTNFKFIIVNDGSTDRTEEVINRYRDQRIDLVNHDTNLGIPHTRNHGHDLAGGEYLALMDADDIANPRRLERQVTFLDQHQDIGVCGTWYEKLSSFRKSEIQFPVRHEEILFMLLFDNCFGQNTIMMRRSFIEKHHLRYDVKFPYSEDYDFWVRCSKHMRLANIPESHVVYRYHTGNSSHRFSEEMARHADRVRCRHLETFGIYPTEFERQLHLELLNFRFNGSLERLQAAGDWLSSLGKAVTETTTLPATLVYRQLSRYWYAACGRLADSGFKVWPLFRSYPMGRQANWKWQGKLLLRSLLRKSI